MTPAELKEQLLLIGVACTIRRDEVVVETCRFCGNPKHNLELNPGRGLFHCWACGAGGRLEALLHEWLGITVSLPVDTSRRGPKKLVLPGTFHSVPAYTLEMAATYLRRRGIPEEVAQAYEITVCLEKGHMLYGRLVLPVKDFWSGVTIGHVGRTYGTDYPKYLSTLNVRMVVGYRMRQASTPCVLVEGIFDGIAVHRAGFHAAVLLGVNAPRFEYFVARLAPTTPVLIMLDAEASTEAQALRWVVKAVRGVDPPVVHLPGKLDPAQLVPTVLGRLVQKVLTGVSVTN